MRHLEPSAGSEQVRDRRVRLAQQVLVNARFFGRQGKDRCVARRAKLTQMSNRAAFDEVEA
jgi:hypothetical protein